MTQELAIRLIILIGAVLLPAAALMFSLCNARFLRYLRETHNATWLMVGPHPPSGRNNVSAFLKFLSGASAKEHPDAELWRLARATSRWLFVLCFTLVILFLSILAAFLLP
jgi:hypothetical protein